MENLLPPKSIEVRAFTSFSCVLCWAYAKSSAFFHSFVALAGEVTRCEKNRILLFCLVKRELPSLLSSPAIGSRSRRENLLLWIVSDGFDG